MVSVLFAEDDESIRKSFLCWFRIWRCEYVVVEDGQQALAKLRERDFDVIITDNTMPNMTGSELLATEQAKKVKLRILHSGDVDGICDKGTHWEISKTDSCAIIKIEELLAKLSKGQAPYNKPHGGGRQ